MATYRSEEEGGGGALSHEAVSDCLCRALDLGADYVDVEYGLPAETRKRLIRMDPSRVVLSRHLTRETPSCEDLTALLDRMQLEGAGVVKIVTLARRWEDNLEVLRLQTVAAERGIASAAFAMGLQGRPSRILSPLLGGVFAFASAAGGAESAPGQLTVLEMRRIMEVLLEDD
jgi:3-dehydroquinate dehydratase type I